MLDVRYLYMQLFETIQPLLRKVISSGYFHFAKTVPPESKKHAHRKTLTDTPVRVDYSDMGVLVALSAKSPNDGPDVAFWQVPVPSPSMP